MVWQLELCTPNVGSQVQSLVKELDPICCNYDLVQTNNFFFEIKLKHKL